MTSSPLMPTVTTRVAACRGQACKKEGNYSPSGLFSEYLTHPVALKRTIVKISTRFAPNSNTTKQNHFLFQTSVNTAWPQRFQSLGLTTSQVIAESKIGSDVGRCHGKQEGRIDGFLANFMVDKSIVPFSFLGVIAL